MTRKGLVNHASFKTSKNQTSVGSLHYHHVAYALFQLCGVTASPCLFDTFCNMLLRGCDDIGTVISK